MTLTDEMQQLREESLTRMTPDQLQAIERTVAELTGMGIEERVIRAGERAPGFSLPNQRGDDVTLDALLERGPAVLIFYRGGWCPYCNLQLRAYQSALDDISALGATLVAISPQRPDESLSAAERNELSFDVLSDVGNIVAREYGLTFALPDHLIASYLDRGRDLRIINDAPDWELPVPGTFVIAPDGIVGLAELNVDHRDRVDPATVLAALKRR